MSPSRLENYLQARQPLRLTLASGDQVIIDKPQHTLVAGMSLAIGLDDDQTPRVTTRIRIVSIPNIVLIEPFSGRHNGGRRRRN